MNKIEDIKRVLKGGARATKYEVRFSTPQGVEQLLELKDMALLAKSTDFPGMQIGQIDVLVQGRKIPIPGDTSYDNQWTVNFYMDNAHKIRKQFIAWMKAIDNFQANTHSGDPSKLFAEMSVVQLDSLEKAVAVYTFKDVWPQNIGVAAIAADSTDQIQEFDVTFSFSSWIVEGTSGSQYNTPNDGRAASTNITSVDQ